MSQSRLVLIDGSGFIFRAYHAMSHSGRPLTSPSGVPVGAVYVYTNMVLKLVADLQKTGDAGLHLAVIFDASRQTFRTRLYPEYKAHRPPTPEDLVPQFPLVRRATEALGIPAIEMPDYEADDIIASYTRLARAEGMEVTVVSSDKDLMQLVGPGVSMFDAMKHKTIAEAEVVEKFLVPPSQVRDVLALIGDSSDNVPGVPSIGPKTAAELIQQFGSLEELLSRAHEISQPKRRETLLTHVDQARLSYQLIGLDDHAPLPLPLSDLVWKARDDTKLSTFLEEMGFKSLLARIGATSEQPAPAAATETRYTTITTEAELTAWIAAARRAGVVAFDTETTSLHAVQAELVGFSLCSAAGQACYVPLAHKTLASRDLFGSATDDKTLAPQQIPTDRAIALLRPLLEDPSVLKLGHNIKYDMIVMHRYGCEIKNFDDTMLMSYLLSAGKHGQGMDELAELYLSRKLISYDAVTGTGTKRIRFDDVAIDTATAYAAEDADVTFCFAENFRERLQTERLTTLYETVEKPLVPVIARMEEAGIKVDVQALQRLSSSLARTIAGLESEIRALAGVEFNPASPKQIGEVLFGHLGLPGGKKSAKTGAYSTDADVLEELAAAGHVIAEKLLAHRSYSKLKNTYCDSLPQQINPKTGRVHTHYGLAITATGRLSSSEPNLQNIPIRSEEGRKIREAFVADTGMRLLSADYSQIELRLLAHMADIAVLKEAFLSGDDIHAITASKVFHTPISAMTPELRRRAKAVNFGIIYGISAHGLAIQLGIGRNEAAEIIQSYFATYPGIRDFMESCKAFARAHGYVETLYKRRCHTPLIHDKNAGRRAFAERAAINAPLQGTAADIIKKAMILIDRELPQDCRMLLQVHDELIFECTEASAQDSAAKIQKIMEGAASLTVPLIVDVGIGNHWGTAH